MNPRPLDWDYWEASTSYWNEWRYEYPYHMDMGSDILIVNRVLFLASAISLNVGCEYVYEYILCSGVGKAVVERLLVCI
jgi:hypothetical protein